MATNFGFICTDKNGPYYNVPKHAIQKTKAIKGVNMKGGKVEYALDTLPPDDKLPAPGAYDYIDFMGSHGDCTDQGQPKMLNGLKGDKPKTLLDKLVTKKVTAKNLLLDCCVTASYIPMYSALLTKGGDEANIIAFWGNAPNNVSLFLDGDKLLAGAICKLLDWSESMHGEMGIADSFQPLVLYVHGKKTLYRKKNADRKKAIQADIDAGFGSQHDFVALAPMDKVLTGAGIKIVEGTAAELVTAIRMNVKALSHGS